MSDQFKDYVTSAAFRLDLSKPMIETLLCLKYGKVRSRLNMASYHALRNRGLIKSVYKQTPDGPVHNDHKLTLAGDLVAQLAELAGFRLEGINHFDRETLIEHVA